MHLGLPSLVTIPPLRGGGWRGRGWEQARRRGEKGRGGARMGKERERERWKERARER